MGDDEKKVFKKFLVIKYEISSAATNIDSARLDMFGRKQKSYNVLPSPTAAFGVPHKEGCLPNMLHLGSGNYPPNGSTEPL